MKFLGVITLIFLSMVFLQSCNEIPQFKKAAPTARKLNDSVSSKINGPDVSLSIENRIFTYFEFYAFNEDLQKSYKKANKSLLHKSLYFEYISDDSAQKNGLHFAFRLTHDQLICQYWFDKISGEYLSSEFEIRSLETDQKKSFLKSAVKLLSEKFGEPEKLETETKSFFWQGKCEIVYDFPDSPNKVIVYLEK